MTQAKIKAGAISRWSTPSEKDDWIQRREQLLDEALKETFPASDPPSIAMPLEP